MAENVHEMWSEDELDRALAALHSDVTSDEPTMTAARADLMAATGTSTRDAPAAPPTPRRHWTRWAAAAAAVVVLMAGFLVVQTIPFGDNPPAASAAAAALNSAADRIHASDPALKPGQYRYVGTHAWWMSSTVLGNKSFSYLAENLFETWVPADQSQEWLLSRRETGARKWVRGSEAEAEAAGIPITDNTGGLNGERRARCGDFYVADEGKQPCTVPGTWAKPTPEFLAGLPRDPQRLYDRLRKDAPQNSRGDAELLVYVADALRSGLIPADLRAAMYRALGKLPGLEITDKLANLDGRSGIAYGMNDGTTRQEIIVDPDTGAFIGERETLARDTDGMAAGTVMSYSSVTSAVVDAMGVRPS